MATLRKEITKERQVMMNLLKKSREEANLSMTEMGKKIGVTYRKIYGYETQGSFTAEVLLLYAKATNKKIVIPVL